MCRDESRFGELLEFQIVRSDVEPKSWVYLDCFFFSFRIYIVTHFNGSLKPCFKVHCDDKSWNNLRKSTWSFSQGFRRATTSIHQSAETPEVCFRPQNENKLSKCFSSCLWVLLKVEMFLSFFFAPSRSNEMSLSIPSEHKSHAIGYLGKENPHETRPQMLWEKGWFRKVFVLWLRLPWFFHLTSFYSHSLRNKNTLTDNPQEQWNPSDYEQNCFNKRWKGQKHHEMSLKCLKQALCWEFHFPCNRFLLLQEKPTTCLNLVSTMLV